MSDFDRNYAAGRSVGYGRAAAVDAGLRAYMLRVYNYMAIGVALTGFAALFMFQLTVTEVGGRLAFIPGGIPRNFSSGPNVGSSAFGPNVPALSGPATNSQNGSNSVNFARAGSYRCAAQ